MIFALEALRAGHGDSLLLHYGPPDGLRRILIDGGPAGTYRRALVPRLDQLRGSAERLRLEMVMVSHIDDDHLAGLVDLFDRACERVDDGKSAEIDVGELWFNAFEKITDAKQPEPAAVQSAASALTAAAPGAESALIAASVAQGVTIRDDAKRLGIAVNPRFDGLVVADGRVEVEVDEHLTLTVLAPPADRLEDLRRKWQEWEAAHAQEGGDAETAAYLDRSVFNLSSIVVLATVGERRILLTGDARGDDILEGLGKAGELDDAERCTVDLLKLPHHGSVRNVEPGFFDAVRARHYLISADGRHGNPDVQTLAMLCDSRSDPEPWTLWLTYGGSAGDGRDGLAETLATFFDERERKGQKVDVRYGQEGMPFLVNLGDEELT